MMKMDKKEQERKTMDTRNGSQSKIKRALVECNLRKIICAILVLSSYFCFLCFSIRAFNEYAEGKIGVNQISTTHQDKSKLSLESKEHEEDPNKIVEIESDDSPPYLPSTTAQQRPKTTTPQPSPTAPPMGKTSELNEDSSFIQADFHHEEGPAFQFNLSGQKEELSC